MPWNKSSRNDKNSTHPSSNFTSNSNSKISQFMSNSASKYPSESNFRNLSNTNNCWPSFMKDNISSSGTWTSPASRHWSWKKSTHMSKKSCFTFLKWSKPKEDSFKSTWINIWKGSANKLYDLISSFKSSIKANRFKINYLNIQAKYSNWIKSCNCTPKGGKNPYPST